MTIQLTQKKYFTPVQNTKAFVYRHIVSFEETNVVGNVYFARHLAWQGRCREMFLRECAPGTLREIYDDLRLVTLNVSCEYFREFHAFDEVEIHMKLLGLENHRIDLGFSYYSTDSKKLELAAEGKQSIGCMRLNASVLKPSLPPEEFKSALIEYL